MRQKIHALPGQCTVWMPCSNANQTGPHQHTTTWSRTNTRLVGKPSAPPAHVHITRQRRTALHCTRTEQSNALQHCTTHHPKPPCTCMTLIEFRNALGQLRVEATCTLDSYSRCAADACAIFATFGKDDTSTRTLTHILAHTIAALSMSPTFVTIARCGPRIRTCFHTHALFHRSMSGGQARRAFVWFRRHALASSRQPWGFLGAVSDRAALQPSSKETRRPPTTAPQTWKKCGAKQLTSPRRP